MIKKRSNERRNWFEGGFLSKFLLLLYIPALLVTFLLTYEDVFDKKIDLNGDNITYYILGKALSTGEGYRNIHQIDKNKNNHYPPGYPLILAAAMQFFPDDVIRLKQLNGLFFLLTIGLLFLIIYRFTGNIHLPFITCMFTILNYHLISFSFIMMSEIPFLLCSTLSILLLIITDFKTSLKTNWLFYILLLCISFTYHIRSTGLALFVGIFLFLLVRRNWKYLGAFTGGFVLLGLPWFLRSMTLGGSSYINQLMRKNPYRPELGQMEFLDWFKRIWTNFERYITREIPSGTFNYVDVDSYKDPIVATEWMIGIPIVLVMAFGLFRMRKYFYLMLYYVIASFGIFLLWPDVWFGTRFLMPLIPFLFFFFIYGITEGICLGGKTLLNRSITAPVHFGMVILSLFFIQTYTQPLEELELRAQADYPKEYQKYFDLARWVRDNAPEQSITCCRKGQLFYFFSGKYVTGYKNTKDKEALIRDLERKGTDYVVLDQLGYASTGRYLYPAVKAYPRKFPVVKQTEDPKMYLLQFRPDAQ